MQEKIQRLQEEIKKKVSPHRYVHSVGVRYTASALAMRYGVDVDKAALAGILHDCAKYGSGEQMLEKARKYQLSITPVEEKHPALLHAKLGAYEAQSRYGVQQEDVLLAIRYHTTGREKMSLLEQIVFLADYIEPNRKIIPGLSKIRQMAFVDLDKAVCMTLKNTLSYLEDVNVPKKAMEIDEHTKKAYAYYQGILQ